MPFEKFIRDFMHPLDQYERIGENEPLIEALRVMKRSQRHERPPILIVAATDSDGEEVIQGFVTAADIVFGIAGHFLEGAEKIGPIFWEGQLQNECLQAAETPVREVMSAIQAYVREDEMIMEAIFLLDRHKVDLLPVTHQNEVTGIIHLVDILRDITGLADRQPPTPPR